MNGLRSAALTIRFTRLARGGALGAVCAQGSQALAGLALQLIAAHSLGLSGFGLFAILYGAVVLFTGVSTGFVGDSLTVLDRLDLRIRSALQGWAGILALGAGAIAIMVCAATGMTDRWAAAAYGLAVVTFVVEDVLRRLLMAHLKFWRIVCVDMSSLLVSLAILAVSAHNGPLALSTFFLALAFGQFAALFLAAGLLPRRERFLVKPIRGGYGTVARYGAWRAAQQGLRPALLTGMRATVGLIVGLAATGQLEAARIYAAPTMLFVSGLSSFLFASFARDTAKPLPKLLRSADRMVLLLVVATIAVGGVFIGVLPWLGHLVTGHALDIWLCVGWFAYSTSIAAVTPYGALAAVRHRQAAVFGWRLADSTLALSLAVIALAMGGGVVLVPVALTVGSVLGGLAIRWFILRRPFPSRPEDIARTISPHHSQAEAHV